MPELISKSYFHEGLGMLFGWNTETTDGPAHQYGILCLDGAWHGDMDAFQTILITGDTKSVYETVRAVVKRMGMDMTEEEFDWANDKLNSAR